MNSEARSRMIGFAVFASAVAILFTFANGLFAALETGNAGMFHPIIFGAALLRAIAIIAVICSFAAAASALRVNRLVLLVVAAAVGAYLELHFSTRTFLFGDLAVQPERDATTGSFAFRFVFLLVMGWIFMNKGIRPAAGLKGTPVRR